MPVLVEIWILLLFGVLAVQLDVSSRRCLQLHNRVTDQVVVLDFFLGLTAVTVTVMLLRLSLKLIS